MKRFVQLAPGIIAGLFTIVLYSAGLFTGPERFFEDILFSKKPIRNDIVIVAIDNTSLNTIGQWPWRRKVFADFLASLDKNSPKAVGVDVIFAEPSRYGESDDASLANTLKGLSYPVILPVEADPLILENSIPRANALVEPRSIFTGGTVSLGHVNLITDPDGVVRRVPRGLVRPNGSTLPLFSGLVVGQREESHAIDRIAYVGPPGSIAHVSFITALHDPSVRNSLAGKYVFIGSTAADLHDEQLTPVSHGVPMSGVEIQAQIAHMFITGDHITVLPPRIVMLWLFFAAFLPSLLFFFIRRTSIAILASVLVGFAYIPIVIVLFNHSVIGNILHVIIAWILGLAATFTFRHYVLEKDRRAMRNVFSKYVSKDVLEEILRDTSKMKLSGEEKEVTIFFSDVRGFTTLAEKLTPIELTQFLNHYLTRMTDIALEHRGVVDKYIGDAIMVFWGAPLSNKEHMLDAMRTSLVMIDELKRFNEENAKKNQLLIDIGIGFNSGRVVVGNMGSEQRFDYTVMGDAVNLASRLESQTKTYGVHIITSEFTMALVTPEQLVANGIFVREIDRIRVKGKELPVTIYEVVENSRIEFVQKIKDVFDQLRTLYYKGEWQKATHLAREILAVGDDGPTKVLLERALHFIEESPEQWEGVYDIKTK